MSDSGGCCRCCFSFILTSGFAALFLWLSLRTHKPKCSIEYFYIPALNQTLNSSSNSTIFFDLRLKNQNKDKSVFYDSIALNLSLVGAPADGGGRRAVANATEPGFHQGRDKKAFRKYAVEAAGVDWKAVSRTGSAVFRLDLATAVRYKILFWKTKRESLRVGAEVKVNGQGLKDYQKGITLSSGAAVTGGFPFLHRPLTADGTRRVPIRGMRFQELFQKVVSPHVSYGPMDEGIKGLSLGFKTIRFESRERCGRERSLSRKSKEKSRRKRMVVGFFRHGGEEEGRDDSL